MNPATSYLFAAAIAFVIVAVLGVPAIALLRKLSFKQHAYEDAPKSHAVKTGTPTMGGILFAVPLAMLAAGTAFRINVFTISIVELVSLGVVCGAIGFADDYSSIVRGKNKGLGAREKFALTGLAGAGFLLAYAYTPGHAPPETIGIGGIALHVPVWLWYALSLCVILSTTHAVNLTDGLDGLAAGTILAPLLLLAYVAAHSYLTMSVGLVDAVTLGAAIGFLVYNKHPAKVFMGDTGSLLLGGVLAGSAILLDQQLLLPVIGGVFVAEVVSVMIQVAYFKRTGKRIFRMSPLHHHFELGGWPETKVTARFWLASVALSLVGFATTFVRSAAS